MESSEQKLYAGIGSRETPPDVLEQMTQFAYIAAKKGWTLRSGAAAGADSAFERGCDDANGPKEIFLPWANSHGHPSPLHHVSPAALKLLNEIHPAPARLSQAARLLCARNMHQILGEFMITPVKLVVCWTRDGCESKETYSRLTGGTGTAISLASRNNIPIFNLRNKDRYIDAIEALLSL